MRTCKLNLGLKLVAALVGFTAIGSVSAATLLIEDQTKSPGQFVASIPGVINSQKIPGGVTSFNSLPTTGGAIKDNQISLNSQRDATQNFYHAQGSVVWHTTDNSNYTFTVSAGALYQGSTPTQCYTLAVYVNGQSVVSNTTLNHGAWSPSTGSAKLDNNSTIEVKLTDSACSGK